LKINIVIFSFIYFYLGLKVNFDPLILITGILPLVITVIGAVFFLIFASSTPKSLLENNHDAFKGKN